MSFGPIVSGGVLERAADHARHGGNGFQHHRPVPVAPGKKSIGKEAEKFHEGKGGAIAKALWCMMVL